MNASKRLFRTSPLLISALALAGCFGNGDGPDSIPNEAVAPLPPIPVGFCDGINFELLCSPPEIINFNGGATTIIDNPDPSGLNTTDSVAQMQKFPDQVFGGTRLNFDELIDLSDGLAWRIKVWSPRSVPFTFKLEETDTTFGPGVDRTHTGSSSWEEFCVDFTGATNPAVVYNGVTVIFENGTLGQADTDPGNWTFYYDEIEQVDSCATSGGGGDTFTTNGGFEDGTLNGWVTATNGGTITVDGTDSNGGNFSVAVAAGRGDSPLLRQERVGAGEIEPGDDVTVTFDMKGSAGAGGVINVELFTEGDMGVSGNEVLGSIADPTAGYTTYSFTGSIPEPTTVTGGGFTDLGTDVSNGVTLQLAAVCGDVEGCVVDVNIDNVTITAAEGTGGGTPPPTGGGGGELLTNGDFEAGASPWLAGVSDPIPASSIISDGGSNVYFANITSPDPNAPFAVNLSQKLTITPGETYTLSFRARSNGNRSIVAGIGLSDGNFANNSVPVNLTDQYQTFTLDLLADGFGDANSRVLFDLNGEAGEVYIDDVSLVVFTPPTFDDGLLTNGDFEAGVSPWLAGVTDPIPASSIITDDGSNVYFANITSPDPNAPFAVNLSQKLTITPGETYTLSFRARSNGDRSIVAGIGLSDGNFANNSVPVDLTATYQDFSIDLLADGFGDANSRVLFDLNGEAGEVYIDNVSLVVATGGGGGGGGGGGSGGNLAVNGDLETGDETGWTNFPNDGTVTVTTDNPSSGTYSINLSVAYTGDGSQPAPAPPTIKQERIGVGTVQANQALTISFDIRGTITQPGAAFFAEFFTETATGGPSSQVFLSGGPITDTITGSWATQTYNVTTGADASGGITLQFNAACGNVTGCAQDVNIDNVVITID